MENKKKFLVLCGPSGSGKTTIANYLEDEHGLRSVPSYTSRPPRYVGERGHTFVSEDELFSFRDIISYTFYNGNHYCTRLSQVDEYDVVVLDYKGINDLLDMYRGDKEVIVIFIETGWLERMLRMLKRGDGLIKTIKRLIYDTSAFRRKAVKRIDYIISGDSSLYASQKIAWYI